MASKGQQKQSRGQTTSFIVVDDQQQAGPSRPLMFTLTLTKHLNPPSVPSATGEESQHISGLSSFFGNLKSVMSFQQIDTPQLFLPVNIPAPAASPPITNTSQQEYQQPAAQPPPPLQSADAKQQPQYNICQAFNQSFSGPLLLTI